MADIDKTLPDVKQGVLPDVKQKEPTIFKRGKTIKGKWTTDRHGNKIINPLYVKQERLAAKKYARKKSNWKGGGRVGLLQGGRPKLATKGWK